MYTGATILLSFSLSISLSLSLSFPLSLSLPLFPSLSLPLTRSLCKAINRGAVMDRHWIDKDEAIITTTLTITTNWTMRTKLTITRNSIKARYVEKIKINLYL